jgi:MoaA/NifB/PqqE/SkfB family radical SAM enzyme
MTGTLSRKSGNKTVTGFSYHFIRICMGFTVLPIALRMAPNPIALYRSLRHVHTIRGKIFDEIRLRKMARAAGRYFPSQNIPGWPSRAFDFFLKQEISAFLDPVKPVSHQTIFFAITNRCPLSCSHCYEWDNMESGEKLSYDNLVTILHKIEDQGIRHIQLSGGEPLARFDDLLSLMRSTRYPVDFWLLTSGFGLDNEKAQRLKDAGLTGVCISLDHWEASAHNEFRNNQFSFSWAQKAAQACLANGIVVSFGICVTKAFISAENLERYYRLCDSWGASFIRLLEPRSVGRFSNQDTKLDPEEIQILENFYRVSHSDSQWKKFPFVSYPGYNQRRTGCLGAGKRYAYIDSHGQFKPCPFCGVSYGSALDVPFGEALNRMKSAGCQIS